MTISAEEILRAIGVQATPEIDLAEAALALAVLDRPDADIERYRRHLKLLAAGVRRVMADRPDTLTNRSAALKDVILREHGYRGDSETYDDLRNADLMHVIDRRCGLPVALGILYIHAARAQGWAMVGLSFPGHFLVRLDAPDGRGILDPFNGGKMPDAAELRLRLQASSGGRAELSPDHYAAVSDRSILLRLQNNIKLRLIGGDRMELAAQTVEHMLLFAPDETELWREAALLHAHLGNLTRAISAIESFLIRAADNDQRHEMAALLQRLKNQLN